MKILALAAGLGLWPGAVPACRLALVLAIDVSSSVDAKEDDLQRAGLADALTSPDVMAAFFASPSPVALTAFEWSGRYNHADLLDWTLIETEADLIAAAATVRNSRRGVDNFPTAMGYALGHAVGKFIKGPVCDFRTIDMAGDGVNNDGFGPAEAYAAFPFEDVTVNGLVVASGAEADVLGFYQQEVIRGPRAFVEIANGFTEYAAAMERKLIRELGVLAIGGLPQSGMKG